MRIKGTMNSRERVFAAVRGLPTDRVPVMYWLNPHAAARMIAEFYPAKKRLYNWFGKRAWNRFSQSKGPYPDDIKNALPLLLQIYANSDYVLERGADLASLPFGSLGFWGRLFWKDGHLRAKDAFGCIRGMGGIYIEVIEPAIKEPKDLVEYKFPDATHERNYSMIRKFRAKHPDACIFADNFGVQDLFSTQIWEMSRFMMALYDYPEEVKDFQRRFADWMIDIARRSVKAGADVIFIYDDYGYTGRPLISMDMWKEFTYPHLKRQIEAVHDAGAIAMLHSCGYQMPFLQYYVDAELDILQSLQPKAGNDFKEAYEKYGDRLAFSTGIDVQQGDFMTAEDLKAGIIESYRVGRTRGRHILGMTHMMQHTMPADNIRAMFDTVREIQAGKYDD